MYSFDDVIVDPEAFCVRKGGEALALEPKAMRVLIYLIENRGRAVGKDELLRAVWEETAVSDNTLTRVIAQLRKALADNPKQARYIETIPTVGYRFIAPVNNAAVSAEAVATKPMPTRVSRSAISVSAGAVALAAVLIWEAGGRAHEPVPAPRVIQLTFSSGYDIAPSFSRDGASVAYASNRNGSFEIFVRPLTVGSREIQVTEDGRQNVQPAWSPDGRYLAYRSLARRGIFIMPALGGVPRPVVDFGSEPTWSPDGKWIAFRSHDGYWLPYRGAAPNSPSTIWLVPAEGGPPRALTADDSTPGRHTSPHFSPNGRRIVFIVYAEWKEPQLWSVAVDGGKPVHIPHRFRSLFDPQYAADGKSILCGGDSETGSGIWRIPIDPGSDRAAGTPLLVISTGSALPTYLTVAASGQRLAYTAAAMTSNLWTLPMDATTSLPRGPSTPLTRDTSLRNAVPAFSPDGTRIAWSVYRRGQPGKIWVADADGGNAYPLVASTTPDRMPNWMPDGRGIIYAQNDFFAAQNDWFTTVWGVKLEDRIPRNLIQLGPQVDRLTLSPEGRELVYHMPSRGVTNLWKTALGGGKPMQLTFDRQSISYPTWSPDGKQIAAELVRGSDTHVAVIPSGGGAVTQITSARGESWVHSWSPDSSKILFAGYREGLWDLYWVALASHKVEKLTTFSNPAGFVRYPAWSPKGDRIVFEQAEIRGNIFTVDIP